MTLNKVRQRVPKTRGARPEERLPRREGHGTTPGGGFCGLHTADDQPLLRNASMIFVSKGRANHSKVLAAAPKKLSRLTLGKDPEAAANPSMTADPHGGVFDAYTLRGARARFVVGGSRQTL